MNNEAIQQFEVTARRCDAWRLFFKLGALERFAAAKGEIISLDQYCGLENLICQFPYKPKSVTSLFRSLMRSGHEQPIQFHRTLLYDSRGWCKLPLSCFVPVDLPENDVPEIQIGLRDMPWDVTSDRFKLYHHIKWNDRIAELYFEHPNEALQCRHGRNRNSHSLNKRGQQVHEQKFPIESKRPEMRDAMLAHVREECAKHHVRIVDLDVLDRLNGEPIQ